MIVVLALPIVDAWCSNTYNAFPVWVPDSQNGFGFEPNEVPDPSTWLEKGFVSMLWWISDIDPTAEDPFDVEVWFKFVERLPRCYFPLESP
jgi:hypothetical protein